MDACTDCDVVASESARPLDELLQAVTLLVKALTPAAEMLAIAACEEMADYNDPDPPTVVRSADGTYIRQGL